MHFREVLEKVVYDECYVIAFTEQLIRNGH